MYCSDYVQREREGAAVDSEGNRREYQVHVTRGQVRSQRLEARAGHCRIRYLFLIHVLIHNREDFILSQGTNFVTKFA